MSKLFSLEKKVAVITGGGSGIGRAVTELFAAQGAIVCIIELNAPAAEEVITKINSTGGKSQAFPCNVTNQVEVTKVFDAIVHKYERVVILVNCAGIAHIG
jgi:NAD(P)-dependent dehydrogenase (short-subunit alcohol dehydrogenase family)